MAKTRKKYKNVKIEQDELKPIAIGMFESRKKNSFGTVLILAIFILVIFFLPQISDAVNNYLNPPINPIIPDNPNKPEEPDDGGDEPEESFYAFADNLKIINKDITVDTFVVDTTNYKISYNITNNGSLGNMEELNYYLEIYNSEKTLLERVKLVNDLTLANGALEQLLKNIKDTSTDIGYLALVKKTVVEYPEVEISKNEDGTGSLVCTNSHEKVTYKFKEDKLKELSSEATYKNTDLDYETLYETNKNLVNTYNSKTGIVSTIFEYNEGYNITTIVNLSEASRIYIFNADSFKLDTMPKVVSFEMEAQGFTCE